MVLIRTDRKVGVCAACVLTSAPAAYSMAWSDRKSFLAVW